MRNAGGGSPGQGGTAPGSTFDDASAGPGQRIGARYLLVQPIGSGSFGVVWLARDEKVGRPVVVKLLREVEGAGLPHTQASEARGHEQIESRLADHPHIVPVLDRDLDTAQPWLVMDYVRGVTLAHRVRAVHGRAIHQSPTRPMEEAPAVGAPSAPSAGGDAAAVRRRAEAVPSSELADRLRDIMALVEHLEDAARAIGFAHHRGVVHRDIKPNNLMLGEQPGPDNQDAEAIKVIDWGLAIRIIPPEERTDPPRQAPVQEAVFGADGYVAPERSPTHLGDAACDVYALGSVLAFILGGQPPHGTAPDAWSKQDEINARLPELVDLVLRARAAEPSERPANGTAFADALAIARHHVALRRLRRHRVQAGKAWAAAESLSREAAELLDPIRPWDDPVAREPGWKRQDDARDERYVARMADTKWEDEVQALLRSMPDLVEAHLELAIYQAEALRRADTRRHFEEVEIHAELLARRLEDTEAAIVARARRGTPLQPDREAGVRAQLGELWHLVARRVLVSLETTPAGLAVMHILLAEKGRRLQGGKATPLGHTPVTSKEVDSGPALLEIHLGPDQVVTHAIAPGWTRHWRGIPPDASRPHTLPMHLSASFDWATDAYVPAGWAIVGGDPRALDPIGRRRLWLDGFVMRRNPVTWGEYLAYLDDLRRRSAFGELLDRMPAVRQTRQDIEPESLDSVEALRAAIGMREGFGDAVLEMPVSHVNWFDAVAYTHWQAERSGLPWRLPCQWEYEKAARGADGRRLPWGDHMEERWTRVINSIEDMAVRARVYEETYDISPYGIRWLAGNVRTWCLDRWSHIGPAAGSRVVVPAVAPDELLRGPVNDRTLRISRGGAFCAPARSTSAASRYADPAAVHMTMVGIRLTRSLTDEEKRR